jgi:hypothetical protein
MAIPTTSRDRHEEFQIMKLSSRRPELWLRRPELWLRRPELWLRRPELWLGRPELWLGLVLALGAGCATTEDQPGTDAEAVDQEATKKANKAADRAHELSVARLELELAELGARSSTAEAERGVRQATLALSEAERDLAVFRETERPHAIAEAVLELDQADHRRETEHDELNELIAMYAAEDFAAMTKELVLKRGRKNLEFAERELELARAELDHLQNLTLPKKERELEAALEKARGEHAQAEAELAKARLEATKSLAEARQEITVLERPLEDEDEDEESEE